MEKEKREGGEVRLTSELRDGIGNNQEESLGRNEGLYCCIREHYNLGVIWVPSPPPLLSFTHASLLCFRICVGCSCCYLPYEKLSLIYWHPNVIHSNTLSIKY